MHAITLLYGNEPFLIEEAAQAIQKKIADTGAEIVKIHHPQQADWLTRLRQEMAQFSLFSPSKLIYLQFYGKCPATEMIACAQLLENLPAACSVLIQAGYLSRQQQQTKWFEAIKKRGIALNHWAPRPKDFPQWVAQRAKQLGLTLTQAEISLICYHTEGNCLAAAQALDLRHLCGTDSSYTEQSQFDVSDLIRAVEQQDKEQILKILNRAKETDAPPLQLVLWALANSLRSQKDMQSLAQLTQIDQSLKTGDTDLIWERLLDIAFKKAYIKSVVT